MTPQRRRLILFGGQQSSLLNGLISYWKMDEASGTAIDSIGVNALTANNNPLGVAGKINNAREFVAASSQSLQVLDNPSFDFQVFTWAAWVKLTTKTATMVIAGKYLITGGQEEWMVRYTTGSDRFEMVGTADGSTDVTLTANNFGSPSVGVWYLLVAKRTSAGLMSLSINNGTPNTTALASLFNGTAEFRFGARGGGVQFLNGALDESGLWSRELTADETTNLFNLGAGKTPPFA